MDSGTSLVKVDNAGTEFETLVNVHPPPPPFPRLLYGFYADVSPVDSRIVYVTCEFAHEVIRYPTGSQVRMGYEIATMESDGSDVRRLTENAHVDHFPVWSPDGGRIAFLRGNSISYGYGSPRLYTMAADGSDEKLLTLGEDELRREAGVGFFPPIWSPDGERLAFIGWNRERPVAYNNGIGILYTVRADGTELTAIGPTASLPTWSPDSQELAYTAGIKDSTSIHVVRPDGEGLRTIWELESANYRAGVGHAPHTTHGHGWGHAHRHAVRVAWSPTGSHIGFVSDAVYVMRPDGSGLRRLVKRELGEAAYIEWSPTGDSLAVFTSCYGAEYSLPKNLPFYCGFSDDRSYLIVTRPDGSDLRVLANGDWVLRAAWHSPSTVEPVDLRVCSQDEVVPEPEANPGLVRDCETLLLVRDTLVGGGEPLPWDGGTPIDQWQGVEVERDGDDAPLRVRSLELQGFGLKGTLPPQLSRLTELRSLNLSGSYYGIGGNSLTGPIPPEWSQLSKLRSLCLTGNLLSGPIPAELGGLSQLKFVALTNNHLSGSIPPRLGGINLFQFTLARNNFSEEIPPELGGFPQLDWLDLSGNQLTGEIPSELGGLARLMQLDLSDNQLTGGIPSEFANLPDQYETNLQHNNLTGCIGAELPDVWLAATGLERCANEEVTRGLGIAHSRPPLAARAASGSSAGLVTARGP